MHKSLTIFAVAALALVAGCFENKKRPQDATPITSLRALNATNRADVTRLYLRAGAEKLEKDSLSGLTNLRELDLSERRMAEVPAEVFAIESLESLWLAYNQLTNFPVAVTNLPNLSYLNLDGNKITSIPKDLGYAQGLLWLRLNNNQIEKFPEDLGGLQSLRSFYAKNNRLKAVPEFLKSSVMLDDVILDGNPEITAIPDWLAKKKLSTVSFSGCRIEKLPEDLSRWTTLKSLSLGGCPISSNEMARIRKALGTNVALTF